MRVAAAMGMNSDQSALHENCETLGSVMFRNFLR
jgi:hypothetical protein